MQLIHVVYAQIRRNFSSTVDVLLGYNVRKFAQSSYFLDSIANNFYRSDKKSNFRSIRITFRDFVLQVLEVGIRRDGRTVVSLQRKWATTHWAADRCSHLSSINVSLSRR